MGPAGTSIKVHFQNRAPGPNDAGNVGDVWYQTY
jgi:hypothetical protein